MEYFNLFIIQKTIDIDEELIKAELNKLLKEIKEIKEFNLSEIVLENWDENKLKTVLQSIKENGFEKTAIQYSNSFLQHKVVHRMGCIKINFKCIP